MSTEITIAKKIDGIVLSVIGQKGLIGFEKAHKVSTAILELEKLLDDNYMKPIMALQGTTLGFKTDKDLKKENGSYVKGDGYPVSVVRRCLIEAVLKGYQPTNNEFNIISGNMYPAKNGLRRRANEWPGLKNKIVLTIKSVSSDKSSALVEADIKWSLNGSEEKEIIPIPLKIDSYTSVDAMLGKAERKALAWLLTNVSGEPVIDGDVDDIPLNIIPEPEKKVIEKPTISDSDMEQALREYTIEQLESTYTISDAQKLKFG